MRSAQRKRPVDGEDIERAVIACDEGVRQVAHCNSEYAPSRYVIPVSTFRGDHICGFTIKTPKHRRCTVNFCIERDCVELAGQKFSVGIYAVWGYATI